MFPGDFVLMVWSLLTKPRRESSVTLACLHIACAAAHKAVYSHLYSSLAILWFHCPRSKVWVCFCASCCKTHLLTSRSLLRSALPLQKLHYLIPALLCILPKCHYLTSILQERKRLKITPRLNACALTKGKVVSIFTRKAPELWTSTHSRYWPPLSNNSMLCTEE